jgi:LacI family transcriptional regulator, galactose operon repressor
MAYVTLRDIAKNAKVSINTVSRALKDRSDISEATKKRIQLIANDLGYIPNVSASRLRSKENKMIGVLITHLDNGFYTRILQGISDAFADTGYMIIALSSNEDLKTEESLLKTLVSNRVAGTIIVPSQDLINTLDYDHLGVPHITIVRKGNRNTRSFFITDSYESGKLAADHFSSAGCSNPAYLGFNIPVSCNRDRLSGYREGLHDNGLPLPKERIFSCPATHQAAYDEVKKMLAQDNQIDSIFVYNDLMALGVLRAFHDMGIKAKDDIRILGHDDIADSRFYVPALSTISVPKHRLGYDSALELIGLIENSDTTERNVIYRPVLIERET